MGSNFVLESDVYLILYYKMFIDSIYKEAYWNTSHKGYSLDKEVSGYASKVETRFPHRSLVLDLGGGRGFDAIYFAERGHYVTLVDISDYALQIAVEKAVVKGLTIKTIKLDLGEDGLWSFDDQFDVVYSRLALHYFDEPKTTQIFKNINRSLKPGGKTYLTIKSPQDETEMNFLRGTAQEILENVFVDGSTTKTRFSKDQLSKLIQQAGISDFSIKKYRDVLNDITKSGNKVLLCNEITWTK